MLNRYSFPIDDQTTLVFLDPLCRIGETTKNMTVDSFNDLYKINCFAATVLISDGTDIEEDLNVNDWVNELSQISMELRDSNICEQFTIVGTNCPPHVLNLDRPKRDILGNANCYFMQNSAYQLFRARSTAESEETDFHKAMETIQQIVNNIVNGIHRQMQNK